MARETELGFKIKRVLGNDDQWKKIVKETEAFYDKLESNPAEINIGDLKHTIVQLQQVRSEYDKINNDASSNRGQIEFAETLYDVLAKAEEKFYDIGIMFKNVNDDTKKYVTGLVDIINHLADSNFGVKFLDIGAQFGFLQDRATELFDTLKSMNTVQFGRFNLDFADMDVYELRDCVDVLRDMQDVVEQMTDIDPNMNQKDFVGRLSPDDLSDAVNRAENDLEDLRRLRISTTAELRQRREIIHEIEKGYTWDDDEHELAKRNIHDEEAYENSIKHIQRYIENRQRAIDQLKENEYSLFAIDGISSYVNMANAEIERLQGLMKELQDLRNGNTNGESVGIDFTEVVEALKEIKDAVREIKDAFDPLTQAFSNEKSAIHAMVTSNVNQLEELINKFKEVHEMVDSLNKKEFNITNVTQNVAGKSDTSSVLDTYQTEANNLLKIITKINDEILGTFGNTGLNAFGIDKSVLTKLFDLARNEGQLKKDITKAKGVASIQSIYNELYEQYLQAVFKASSKVNAAIPGFIDISKLDKIKNVREMKESALDTKVLNDVTESVVNNVEKSADVNVDTGKILNQIQTLGQQTQEELKTIRQQIEATFDFSTLDPNLTNVQSITAKIYQQFEELQQNIKKLDFKIEAPNMDGVVNAIQVIKQEGEVAEGATPKKDAFTEANQKLADSMKETGNVGKVAADGVQTEAESVEKAAKTVSQNAQKIRADQDTIADKYRNIYGGRDKVNANLASNFNKVIETAGVDVSSIKASFGVKSYKDQDKNIIEYDYIRLIAEGTDELGKATTITREYEVATGGLIKKMSSFKDVKDTFNIAQEVETANSKVAELEKRMGSFKIDLTAVKKAAKDITDETSLDIFEKELDAANQKLKELKATLKSSKSLDPVVNSESMMSNLEKTVETYRENIKKFSDVEGFGELETHLTNITTHLNAFNKAKADGNGKDMADAVAKANKEIAKYNAQLNLVKARYQENNRVAKETENNRKKALQEEKALLQEIAAEDRTSLDKDKQFSLLSKQKAQWEKNGQLTDELRHKIDGMLDSLSKVTNSDELSTWKTQWSIVKNEVMETKYQIDAAKKAQAEINKADAKVQRKENEDRAYWDKERQRALDSLITPEKRPELEQLKSYMLQQASVTKESVEEQYDAIMSIISNKNKALQKLMSASGVNEKQHWQDEYSAWFGAWNSLDKDVINNFFEDAGNQAILGADKIEKFNNEIKHSQLLAAKSKDQEINLATKQSEEALAQQKALLEEEKALMKEIVSEDKFNLDKDKQFSLLEKQQAQWKKNGQLTDEVNSKINDMLDSLSKVTDSNELAMWKKKWSIVKDEIMATKYEIDAANKAQKAIADERKSSGDYWDKEFRYSLNNIITPEKRPELEQLKAYMLQQAESTEDAVKEQYDAIFTIIKNKNDALQKLMSAKGPNDKQYWQDQYSAWYGAWNGLDKDVVSDFFADAGNQAILGAGKLAKFNDEKERSIILDNKLKDLEHNKRQKEQDDANKENKNFGKEDFDKLNKFSESMHTSIRALQKDSTVSTVLSGLVAEFDEAYTKIETMRKQFNDNPASVTPELKTQFQDSVHYADTLRQKIADIFKESQNINKIGKFKIAGTEDVSKVDDLKTAMIAFANSTWDGQAKISGFNKEGTQMYVTLDQGAGSVENITVVLDKASGHLQAFTTGTNRATNEWNDFKKQISDGAKRMAGMYLGFNDLIRYGREGVKYVKEIDLAMTELKKVTDETDESYKQFLKDAGSTASVIGSTISDFTNASATFARLGYSLEESASMAETAIIYKNVAD